MTLQQKQNGRKFINLVERGDPDDNGDANVENDHDGRGLTEGEDGYTTANGDALEVVLLYQKVHPVNHLTPFIPELQRLAKAESDDVSHLQGFAQAWQFEAKNPSFRAAQQTVGDRLYFYPAMAYAKQYNYDTALGELLNWDTAILQGCGDDRDSLGGVLKRAFAFEVPDSEDIRIGRLIDARHASMTEPADSSTKEAWTAALSRLELYDELRAAKNWNLKLPYITHVADYPGQEIR